MALKIGGTDAKVSALLAEMVSRLERPPDALVGTIAQTKLSDWDAYRRTLKPR